MNVVNSQKDFAISWITMFVVSGYHAEDNQWRYSSEYSKMYYYDNKNPDVKLEKIIDWPKFSEEENIEIEINNFVTDIVDELENEYGEDGYFIEEFEIIEN